MKIIRNAVVPVLVLASGLSLSANANKSKKHDDRGVVEKMEAVPCGAKQRGLSGLGSLWGSIGITHVNSDEKLCPQYLFRTDDADYEIRPLDLSHAVILPVGHEGQFKINKNELRLAMTDGPDRKMRNYQVVAINPPTADTDQQKTVSGSQNEH